MFVGTTFFKNVLYINNIYSADYIKCYSFVFISSYIQGDFIESLLRQQSIECKYGNTCLKEIQSADEALIMNLKLSQISQRLQILLYCKEQQSIEVKFKHSLALRTRFKNFFNIINTTYTKYEFVIEQQKLKIYNFMLALNGKRSFIQLRTILFQSTVCFSHQKKNQYQILNVKQTASFEQIKKSFLALSKLYHPDYYKGNQTNKFHQIQDAFKKIYSPKDRKQVDLKLGIKNSLWQNQNLKATSQHFSNQYFQQMLKTQLGIKNFRTLQERLQEKFKDQIDKQISKIELIKLLWAPALIFTSIWLCYNTLEQVLIGYKGNQQHIVEVQQNKKKLSSVPINIR